MLLSRLIVSKQLNHAADKSQYRQVFLKVIFALHLVYVFNAGPMFTHVLVKQLLVFLFYFMVP